MRRYGFFQVPVWSFFSSGLYRDVCFRWKGTGFGYLFLLLAVAWVAPLALMQKGFSAFVREEAPKVIGRIPEVTIRNGQASLAEEQPYVIKDETTGETVAVFDTTGAIKTLEEAQAKVLVTRTEVLFKKNEFETRTYSFAPIREEFTLTREKMTRWLGLLETWAIPALYPFALLGSFVFRILQVLLYAVFGLLLTKLAGSSRSYPELVRLAAVAITPVILIRTALEMGAVRVPAGGLLFFLAAMGWLFFGVKSAASGPEE